MDGGGVSSGGSSCGSLSTVSKEDNLVMVSSEVSSSYPDDEYELELGLGLSLGCGGGGGSGVSLAVKSTKPGSWGQGRILTAQDFPSAVVSKVVSSSSSCSSATPAKPLVNTNAACGTKRSADSFSPSRSGVSQVVGWPPVRRTYRMNSLVSQAKSPTSEACTSAIDKSKKKSLVVDKNDGGSTNRKKNDSKAKDFPSNSLFVKVNMDGIPIGRKMDLNAHDCYETLARALDDMFCTPSNTVGARTSSTREQGGMTEAMSLRLLDGTSDFVLTYEDKDGDWMLVGDVPFEMFITSVKRLRIMRTSEANGLASGYHQRSERQRTQSIWT